MHFPAMTILACFGIVLVLDVLHWLFQTKMPAEATENNGNVAVIKAAHGETVEFLRKDRNEPVAQFVTKVAVGTVSPARVTLREKHSYASCSREVELSERGKGQVGQSQQCQEVEIN